MELGHGIDVHGFNVFLYILQDLKGFYLTSNISDVSRYHYTVIPLLTDVGMFSRQSVTNLYSDRT